MNLYTILINFADHQTGIGQFNTSSPENALMDFINTSDSLKIFNREKISYAFNKLIQSAEINGFWTVLFKLDILDIKGEDSNTILGGYIIQTDIHSPIRLLS